MQNSMKCKKTLRKVAIILSIILLLLNICLYVKMKFTWDAIPSASNQYDSMNLLFHGLFSSAVLVYGIILIPIVWIEYLLLVLVIKIYHKFDGIIGTFLCLLISIIFILIFIFFVRMLIFIILTLI